MPDEPATTLTGTAPEGVDAQAAELDFEGQAAQAPAAPAAPAEQTPATPPEAPAAPATEETPEWSQRFASPEEMWEALRNEQRVRGDLANRLGEERAERERIQQAAQQIGQPQQQPDQAAVQRQAVLDLTPEHFEQIEEEHGYAERRKYELLQNRYVAEDAAQATYDRNEKARDEAELQEYGVQLKGVLTQHFGADRVAAVTPALLESLPALAPVIQMPDGRVDVNKLFATFEFIESQTGSPQPGTPSTPNGAGERTTAGSVFVEGGSTPPPPATPPRTEEEAIKAEIDGAAPGRDAFGQKHVPAVR